jgi:hypothetical protein
MQITPYNLHVLGSFPPSLGCFEQPKFTRRLGADTVIESDKRFAEKRSEVVPPVSLTAPTPPDTITA